MSDSGKVKIKDKIRYLIYRHRYFSDADLCMEEKQLEKYEKNEFMWSRQFAECISDEETIRRMMN